MWQSFVCQELRHEHDQEGDQEKRVCDELRIGAVLTEPFPKEAEQEDDREQETSEKGDAGDRIENRIGRVVVAPVHVADEIVLDE